MRLLPATLALLIAIPALAQTPPVPGAAETARVTAGTYRVEPNHTQILFAVDHLGFSVFRGFLSQASGTLLLDPANASTARLSVSVPIGSLHTSSDALNQELVGADWFDAARYPTAQFVSSKVILGPNNMALVQGSLTLHGVTRPAEMRVHFHGAGTNPMSKAPTIGFDARMTIERSAFGIAKDVPLISDRVELTFAAAFEKQEDGAR